MKFNLVILQVNNLDNSLIFYNELLGMNIIKRFSNNMGGRIAFLSFSDKPEIELVETGSNVKTESGAAISFTLDDAKPLIERVKARIDTTVTGPICPSPETCFYFISDPDGYRVQLMQI